MNRLVLTVFAGAPLVAALAQDMAPPKQVTDLGWMVGTWSGAAKMSYGGQEVAVSTTMVASFDGQFVKAVSTNDEGGKKSTETMMLGWNPAKGEYVSYTFTGFAPMPGIKHGKLDGANLVMISEPWDVGGMTIVSRETFAKESDSKFKSLMDFKDGDKWDQAMVMEMTKQ